VHGAIGVRTGCPTDCVSLSHQYILHLKKKFSLHALIKLFEITTKIVSSGLFFTPDSVPFNSIFPKGIGSFENPDLYKKDCIFNILLNEWSVLPNSGTYIALCYAIQAEPIAICLPLIS